MKSVQKVLDPDSEILSAKESQSHLRISKRQREKQERELQKKKEEAAEKELAGELPFVILSTSILTIISYFN